MSQQKDALKKVLWMIFCVIICFQTSCLGEETIEHTLEPSIIDSTLDNAAMVIEAIPVIPPKETVYTVQSGDTFLNILTANQVVNRYNVLQAIADLKDLSWDVTKIRPGDTITFVESPDDPPFFKIELSKYQTLIVKYTDPISAEIAEQETEIKSEVIESQIESSFWQTASQMTLTANQIQQVVKVFETHIDFGTEIYGGETLTIWADRIFLDEEVIAIQKLHSITLKNRKETIQLYQIELDDQMVWLDKEGRSVNRPFLRSPVEYNFISSKFGVKREKGYHGGVDFAAVVGVPVRAVANGTVKLASWNGGYGKQVQLLHPEYGPYLTSYAHLSEIKVKKGQKVKQGDIIGLVGSTGNSTGPHVHYELRVKGERVNPLEYQLPNAHEISKEQQATFQAQILQMENRFLHPQDLNQPLILSTDSNEEHNPETVLDSNTFKNDFEESPQKP